MMKIKQQNQIKKFLIEEFGAEKGCQLFGEQEKTLDAIVKNTKNKSKNQMKTLVQTILPRVALYKTLANDCGTDGACEPMRKYMFEKVAAQKHSSMVKMESVPGFYFIYSRIFLKFVRGSDLWESEQSSGKDRFDVTMKKCLWHTACAENGCAELCRLFCDVDDVTYGGLSKLRFERKSTLGYGADCCDFHFFKK